MPIYEYQCTECEHELEKLQKISDDPLTDCPECGKPALRKMVSAAAFRLKGSGWYETDFKTGKKRNVSGGSTESSSGSDSGGGDTTKSSDTAKSNDSKSSSSKDFPRLSRERRAGSCFS